MYNHRITSIHHHNTARLGNGHVSLVGAGPGDADLLTIKALRTIRQADIIIYDRLVSQEIVNLFPVTTPRIYVGKAKGCHHYTQEAINELLLAKAKAGLHVCRLKGGDAFVFGRGSEEMQELFKHHITVDVIPGITAASGATAYAGIPLTHRGISQGCTFITAHAEKELTINWQHLVGLKHTLVFYMGLSKANEIRDQLIAKGAAKNTPVALIENGSNKNQRTITGVLENLAGLVAQYNVKAPALIVIGEVVNFSGELAWFMSAEQQQMA